MSRDVRPALPAVTQQLAATSLLTPLTMQKLLSNIIRGAIFSYRVS